ncbi:hypothetical protein [Anaerotignum sp.]
MTCLISFEVLDAPGKAKMIAQEVGWMMNIEGIQPAESINGDFVDICSIIGDSRSIHSNGCE